MNRIKILEFSYDAVTHRTHALIQTPEFTDWYSCSGQVNQKDFLAIIAYYVEQRMAGYAAALGLR